MSATEEQIALMAAANVSHVSYILLLFSASFLFFLFVCMLLNLYASYALPITSKNDTAVADRTSDEGVRREAGRLRNGHPARVARDAEEFELEGLMSDEEEAVGTSGKMTPATSTTNGIVGPRLQEQD